MKKLIIVLMLMVLIIPAVALTGCVKVNLAEKNGPLVTRTYDFTDFTGVDVGHAMELTLTQSENYSVSVTAGNNVMQHLNVYKSGGILVFEIDGWTDAWFSTWYSSPKVKVTMPMLAALNVSGAASADVKGFKSGNDLNLQASGSSDVTLDMETGSFTADISGASTVEGTLKATRTDIELSGSSDLQLTGMGGDIWLRGSGASEFDLLRYTTNNADIRLSGATSGSLTVNGRLDVELSGASDFEYAGNPTLGNIDTGHASNLDHIPNTD